MVELSARRVIAVAAASGALLGGLVAGGVAATTTGARTGSPTAASEASSQSLATAAVVRTTLTNTVQVGGSIGFEGSYTVAVPSGASAQQVSQAEQTVAEDQQALGADTTTEVDTSTSDGQATAIAQNIEGAAESALAADRAAQTAACSAAARPARHAIRTPRRSPRTSRS